MSRKRKRTGGRPPVVDGQAVRSDEPLRAMKTGQHIDLGDLSAVAEERAPVIADFGYAGVRYRVNPGLSEVDVMDFMDEAQSLDPNAPQAVTLVKRWARATIHPDDFDALWKVLRDRRQDSAQIMALMWAVLDGVTDLPTGQPSASSGGLPNTSQNSQGGSSAPDADPSTPAVYRPEDLYGPATATQLGAEAEAFLKQIDRFQARGDGYGVAMAAQIARMAESRGIDVRRDRSALPMG